MELLSTALGTIVSSELFLVTLLSAFLAVSGGAYRQAKAARKESKETNEQYKDDKNAVKDIEDRVSSLENYNSQYHSVVQESSHNLSRSSSILASAAAVIRSPFRFNPRGAKVSWEINRQIKKNDKTVRLIEKIVSEEFDSGKQ